LLVLFALVASRVGGLLLGAPVFSTRGLPQRFKAMLLFVLSAAILPAIPSSTLPESGYAVAVAMVNNFAVGFAIGLLVRIFLTAFQLAGAMISFQMGFAMARSLDPTSGDQVPVIATIHLQMVTTLFLLMDGHHLLIQSVAASYEAFPIAATVQLAALNETLFSAGGLMYEAGARIAGPVTGVMLLINSLMGLLNRIVPTLSIFNIGFPITVMSGLIVVTLSIPEVVNFFFRFYGTFERQLAGLLIG